jgi:hypothetical protein
LQHIREHLPVELHIHGQPPHPVLLADLQDVTVQNGVVGDVPFGHTNVPVANPPEVVHLIPLGSLRGVRLRNPEERQHVD